MNMAPTIGKAISDVDQLIIGQAQELSDKLKQHRLEMFPPRAMKNLREFQLAEDIHAFSHGLVTTTLPHIFYCSGSAVFLVLVIVPSGPKQLWELLVPPSLARWSMGPRGRNGGWAVSYRCPQPTADSGRERRKA